MSSLSLYRKYRSQTFDELVGQEPVVRTLKNAIATGRIGHAYLFTGPRGVGKTSAARLLARAANCLSGGPDKPCNQCDNCLAAGRDIATDLIEIDAASNTGVDNIREVIERAQFAPSLWHTKFYVIDEAHMLTVSAFNALLKTLEEPPPHVAFILATTEVHKVPATVASRCQRFDFRRVPLKAMVDRLRWICEQEGIEAEDAALELVARQSTGSLRDAESLMDQLRVFAEGAIRLADVQDMLGASGSEQVADFVDCLVAGDLAGGLRLINSVAEEGLDIRQFNRQIVEHLHGLILVKSGAAQGEGTLVDVTTEMRGHMNTQSAKVSIADLLRWTKGFAEADGNLRTTTYRHLPLELALVEAVMPPEEGIQKGQARENSGDMAASIEQVGVPPSRTRPIAPGQPSMRPETRATQQAPANLPPPIHSELGNMGVGTGAVMPVEGDTSMKPQPSHETPAGDDTQTVEQARPNGHGFDGEDVGEKGYPGPESGGNEDELGRLKRSWSYLIDQINAHGGRSIAAVFRDPDQARPYSVVGKVVTVSFRHPIHVQRSRNEKARAVIEQALARTLGYQCVLESITFNEEGKGPGDEGSNPASLRPQDKGPKPPAPHETSIGKAAMNIFGIEKFEDG